MGQHQSLHAVLQCYIGHYTPSASHLSVGAFVSVCRVMAGVVFRTVLNILLLPCLPSFRILEFFYYMDSNLKESAIMKTYKRDSNVQFLRHLPLIFSSVLSELEKVILAVKRAESFKFLH